MMKRNILILVVLTLILSACGQKVSEKKPQPEKKDNQVETEVPKTQQETTVKTENPEAHSEDLEGLEDIQTKYSDVDTSDWQTYTDENGLFSFKYPKDWEVIKNEYGHMGVRKIGRKYIFEEAETNPLILSLNGRCTYEVSNSIELKELVSSWAEDYEIKNFKIGGVRVYETNTHLTKNFFVYLNSEEECYLRMDKVIFGEDSLNRENEVVYKGIISTLKFLK